ncbi:MAG: acyl carrier protein [Candidatus Anaerobiospirillum pullicola]|uniref:Acyl carrier protein n=1 Tax=Candidatus Anaerobiospirillum pullicola TaxID=2838451 RepID=A0A948TI28_9GAMM|nr:acyl carrier protein [Candidatus Anaerobiospirillum pullicola]
MEKDEIFAEIKTMLVNQFELEPEQITLEANLFTDLDLDSIDAIDMVVYLQKKTGKKFSPEQFKTVRTINDVVEVVFKITHD